MLVRNAQKHETRYTYGHVDDCTEHPEKIGISYINVHIDVCAECLGNKKWIQCIHIHL